MKFANINFNPDKCKLIINNPGNKLIPQLTLPDENGEEKQVEICDIRQTVKYLGVPLGTRRLSKMRFNNSKIEGIKKILVRICRSGLKITQILHAIKTFIVPKLDYCFMNSLVSLVEIGKLDAFIRKLINDLVGGSPLSKDLFYTSAKCGGLGLKNLRERYFACKFNNLAHFLVENEDTRNFAFWQIQKEGEARNVKKLKEENFFFDWDMEGINPLKGGYHSLVAEVFHAADQLQIGISYDKDNQKVNIWTNEQGSLLKCKKGETAARIGKILEKRHYKALKEQRYRGRSICTFKDSRISNFLYSKSQSPYVKCTSKVCNKKQE
jgi:hypothetical protein